MDRPRLIVEAEREEDGRWVAEVPALPGALAYGATREEALARVEARDSYPADEDLTTAQVRELPRRMADLDDATRYMLVSQMGPRFALYYTVSEDAYVMNDPRGATLFKRRNAALAVKTLLGGSLRVIRCRSKRVDGIRVAVLNTTKRRSQATAEPSSNQRLQPSAGARRRSVEASRRPRLRHGVMRRGSQQ